MNTINSTVIAWHQKLEGRSTSTPVKCKNNDRDEDCFICFTYYLNVKDSCYLTDILYGNVSYALYVLYALLMKVINHTQNKNQNLKRGTSNNLL